MSGQSVQIDISKPKYEKKKDDIIELRIESHEILEVHFSKLVTQSKYIRDKYKYSEALNMLSTDIEENLKENKICFESFLSFIKLIEEEKINIQIEHIQNIYILSKIFECSIINEEVYKMIQEYIFQDLNFTIQTLQYYERTKCSDQIKMTSKIEEYLSTRINECFSNCNFPKLGISTISRILKKSGKEKIDHNILVDFIVESIDTRFVILIFVDIGKLSEDKIDFLFNFFDKEDEEAKKKYFEYLPFSLSLFKTMKNKYDELLRDQIKTNEELKQIKIQFKREEEEHKKTKEELDRIKNEQEKKQHLPSFATSGGYDHCSQLGKIPNDKTKQSLYPPHIFQLDPSPLLSFSCYCYHSVLITSDSSLKAIGHNGDGRISTSLEKNIINDFTNFCMKDNNGFKLNPVSAVCCVLSTLYICSKKSGNERQLVLCDCQINNGSPIFLDIGNHHPLALFGGYSHSASICKEGEIIFINRNSVKKSPQAPIQSISLPDREKASSIACCEDSIIVLSSKGRVFSSPVNDQNDIEFSEVKELSGKEIVCVSGTFQHVLAVSKDGHVFGRGLNDSGQLGVGKGISSVSSFKEISSLDKYEIRSAYAGCYHSLFETREGKILSCGDNVCDELFLSSGLESKVYLPTETIITSGATFCIAGYHNSTVFIGSDSPQNTPNKRIDEFD